MACVGTLLNETISLNRWTDNGWPLFGIFCMLVRFFTNSNQLGIDR